VLGRRVVTAKAYALGALLGWAGQQAGRHGFAGVVVSLRAQVADLLAGCFPAALSAAAKPMKSATWLACLAVVVTQGHGDPARLRRSGREGFVAAVRQQLPGFGGQRISRLITDRFYTALGDCTGALAQRLGGLERVGFLLEDWRYTQIQLAVMQTRMITVLDTLGLTGSVTSIPGLSALGAASILAETGDPARFATARSVVKHAGLSPAENTSGTFRGVTRVSRRGRPGLRLAAWRAVWAALPNNPVLAAKFTHLTGRDRDRLTPAQARIACAAALLRWLYAITTRRQTWNPWPIGSRRRWWPRTWSNGWKRFFTWTRSGTGRANRRWTRWRPVGSGAGSTTGWSSSTSGASSTPCRGTRSWRQSKRTPTPAG
jgi:hypothetical protein